MVVHAENFDRCMMIARNLRDSNICTDSYINSLETNTKPYVLSILKDYWFKFIINYLWTLKNYR